MADFLNPMQEDYEKPEAESTKITMNPSLINKILTGSKKRKNNPYKRAPKVLLPPCITYLSNAQTTVLKVPYNFSLEKQYPRPKVTDPRICSCGKIAKYREPKTFTPFCSLECFKILN
jgi:HIT zinc finger